MMRAMAVDRWVSVSVLGFALVACGPDELEPAELDEVCGREGPVRILEFETSKPVATVRQALHENGRRLLALGYFGDSLGDVSPDTETRELWSVGSCGESPRRVHTAGGIVRRFEYDPSLVFVCDLFSGDISIIDPSGERPSNRVFTAPRCEYQEAADGIISFEPATEEFGSVVLQPFPVDPWTHAATKQVLLESVRMRGEPDHGGSKDVLAMFPDEVFALDAEDRLLRYALADDEPTIAATDVHKFEVSADRRWLIWQDTARTGGTEQWPSGAIHLLDLASSTIHDLGEASLTAVNPRALEFSDAGLLRLQLGLYGDAPERVYRLPDLTSFELPLSMRSNMVTSDGRLLVGRIDSGEFALVDPTTGDHTPLFEPEAMIRVAEDRLEILGGVACCIQDTSRSEGRLWLADLQGNLDRVANRATYDYQFLSDDRVITTIDVDGRWRGTLIAVDPEDLSEHRIDEHALLVSPRVDDDDTIIYGVADDERSGVWLARLAPG